MENSVLIGKTPYETENLEKNDIRLIQREKEIDI
jgi:hypothetical protein